MNLHLRPAELRDAAALVDLLNPIIEAGIYTALDQPLTVEFERDYIATFPQRGLFYLAELQPQGTVVGCQSLEPFATGGHAFDHVAVIGTFVDLAYRHQGIGTRLAEATFRAARDLGYVKVLTYVRADNAPALDFYRRLGFRTIGTARRQARIRGRYIDQVLIEVFL